jgi:DNA-binding response OmpR family regulator
LLFLGPMPAAVLVLADRPDFANLIGRCLAGIGVRALVAADVRHAGLLLEREPAAVAVLDLALPSSYDAATRWLRRDPARASMLVVRVSALARNGCIPRGETRADLYVPKPFTPRQIVDVVRTALARQAARQRFSLAPPRAAGHATAAGALR